MSAPEVILWSRLRGRNNDRPSFRRQHPIGSVILDFYCPQAGLAIEVDGSTHWSEEAQWKDYARDRWLHDQGVLVMRVWAGEVYRDAATVVDGILARAAELIEAGGPRVRLAPSTTRSAAGGPPPASFAGGGEKR
ncbi:MAG: DUF559 domain-containing protein [Phenylobacterium sp.]|nr:DUF559 domain-containing protein [Phenylobacterium sp.]